MNRRGRLAVAAGLIGLGGCFHNGNWLPEPLTGPKVKTPKAPTVSPKSVQAAQRVDALGRRIIEQNTFTGLEPLFHTVGLKELILFHRGAGELFISEALVEKCKTEPELAAVLCSELGRMMAETRAARELGHEPEPFPEIGDPAKAHPKPAAPKPTGPVAAADPDRHARDLLRGAGFDPAELDKLDPLLKQVDRNFGLRKQMAGTAPAPTWQN